MPLRGIRGRLGETSLPSARGFTLLELLIATAVGAIVLLVIQTTYFSALRLHNTTHARIDQDLEMQRALAIVRRDFAGLMLPGGTFAGQFQSESSATFGSENHGERITPDMCTSTGRIDGFNPFSEAQRVAYYLADGAERGSNSTKNFVRVVTRNLLPVQESDEGEDQVLLEGVLSATVSFYDGTAWTDTWDSEATSTLPRALKLSLVMAPHEASQSTPAPIDLVVPVLVRTTTAEREDQEAATP
jgi:type II secretion system protein J